MSNFTIVWTYIPTGVTNHRTYTVYYQAVEFYYTLTNLPQFYTDIKTNFDYEKDY
jgi:hypothetical protein